MVFSLQLSQSDRVPTMTLRIKPHCENHGTRICLCGELRYGELVNLRNEIDQFERPATLDLDEISTVDIDGIRFLNECQAQGIQVENCSSYIREWMLQEKQARHDEE